MKPIIFVAICLSNLLCPLSFARQIALTFDDAPRGDGAYFTGVQRTQALISRLSQLGVKEVAFFCNTNRIGLSRIEQYAKAGHWIANHTHTHPSLHDVGPEAFTRDMEEAEKKLISNTRFIKWFRFPFLHEGKTVEDRDYVRRYLQARGYRNGYVTVDTYDWYMSRLFEEAIKNKKKVHFDRLKELFARVIVEGVEYYDGIAQATLGRSPKHVLLLHENDLTVVSLDKLVGKLREKGWEIISPVEAYTDPIASEEPETLFLGQGRVAALARLKGYSAPILKWEDEELLDKLFEKEKVFE